MGSTTVFLLESALGSERSEPIRRHSAASTTLYWHDCSSRHAGQGYWAAAASSPAHAPCPVVSLQTTSPLTVEEHRRRRLGAKSTTGLHSLFTTIRRKPSDPPSKRQNYRRQQSTSSIADISSIDVKYSPRSYLQARQQSSPHRPDQRPDLSALVPDYLDDPPPYSSPVRERPEVIDWKAHFDRTPLLARTASPHSSSAIQDVMSLATSAGGAWDRVARRLSR